MKVLHVGNVPLPEWHSEFSCVSPRQHKGRWVLDLAKAQRLTGATVEIISMAPKATSDFTVEVDGIRVHYLRTFHPYRHLTFFAVDQIRMARLARRLAPDIVVAHGTESVYGWAAVRSGLPFCLIAQGLYFQILARVQRRPTMTERFFRAGESYVWRHSNHAVAVSRYVEGLLRNRFPNLDIETIPLPCEPLFLNENPVPRGTTLAFVGSFSEWKGLPYLVEAIQILAGRFPGLEMHLAGNPGEHAAGMPGVWLASLREVLGPRLHLHGILRPEDLSAMLRSCAVLAAPSLEDMFGCQVVEALLSGCHCVVSDDTALAENVRRFGNGTVVPQRDAVALADAVEAVFRAPPAPETVSASQKGILREFSPETIGRRHLEYYQRILGGST